MLKLKLLGISFILETIPMIHISQLSNKDYRSIKQIYKRAFSATEHPTCDLHYSWDSRSQENSYGVFLDSTLVGFAICSFPPHSPSNIYLDYIAIDEDFRGHGYGSLLLNTLLDKCRNERKSLHLFPDSFEVAAWYKTFGFYETLDPNPIEGKPPYYLNWHSYERRQSL